MANCNFNCQGGFFFFFFFFEWSLASVREVTNKLKRLLNKDQLKQTPGDEENSRSTSAWVTRVPDHWTFTRDAWLVSAWMKHVASPSCGPTTWVRCFSCHVSQNSFKTFFPFAILPRQERLSGWCLTHICRFLWHWPSELDYLNSSAYPPDMSQFFIFLGPLGHTWPSQNLPYPI